MAEVAPWLITGCVLSVAGRVLAGVDEDRGWISWPGSVIALAGLVFSVLGISFAIRVGIRSQR
jgi:hypothetical protein